MKKRIFLMLILAMTSLFFIACGDSNTTVKNKNCANSCDKTWQQCNEDTQKCEPKDGFCADNDACKADATKPKCNNETHLCVADKCSDAPCDANTENGNTVCKLDASTEGYSCVCKEGFEFDENNKCVEKSTNPCDAEPCKDNTEGKTVCKVDENAENGYTCEKPIVLDPCEDMPCKDDPDGKTLCKADETVENGYICELPQECNGTNECTDIDSTKCDGDKLMKCVKDDVTYCTVWKETVTCDAGKCTDNNDGAAYCKVDCTNTCTDIGATKCTGDRLIECVKDDVTYCTVWQDTTNATDCGAGLCTDNNDGAAYCECQECNPDTFNQECSNDLKSFQYCDNTNGCFTIKTINCEGAKHCSTNESGNLECIDNTCTDDTACSNETDTQCATSGQSSILQGCKTNSDGCLELYTITDCGAVNMECNEYNGENQCIGGEGASSCQGTGAGNNDNEILMNGIWVGNTQDQNDNYKGCSNDDFNGQDVVYTINIEQGQTLNLAIKKLDDNSSTLKVKPAVYVIKGNCNNSTNCNSSQADNNDSDASTSLSLANMEAGTYHIIVDSDKVDYVMTSTDSYKYELTVDLQ